jgi:hypothetical protein
MVREKIAATDAVEGLREGNALLAGEEHLAASSIDQRADVSSGTGARVVIDQQGADNHVVAPEQVAGGAAGNPFDAIVIGNDYYRAAGIRTGTSRHYLCEVSYWSVQLLCG